MTHERQVSRSEGVWIVCNLPFITYYSINNTTAFCRAAFYWIELIIDKLCNIDPVTLSWIYTELNNDTIVRQVCTETNHHTWIHWDVSNTTETGPKVQTARSVSAWTLTQSSQRSRLYAPLSQARAGPQDSTWDLLCWRAHWPDSDSSAVGREQSSIHTQWYSTHKKRKRKQVMHRYSYIEMFVWNTRYPVLFFWQHLINQCMLMNF